jgi:hypothetical protein
MSLRRALALLLLATACAGGSGSNALPDKRETAQTSDWKPAPTSAWDAQGAAALHTALVPHGAELTACVKKALAANANVTLDPHPTATLTYKKNEGGYALSLLPGTPEDGPPSFGTLLGRCAEERAKAWGLPAPTGEARLGFHVLVRPATEEDALPNWQPCFEDPAAASLRTTLSRDAAMAVHLWVTERTYPKKVAGEWPKYTPEATEKKVEGQQLSACDVKADGRLKDCGVVAPLPPLDRPIIEGMKTWLVQPVYCNGRPIEQPWTFRFDMKPPRERENTVPERRRQEDRANPRRGGDE